MRKSIRSIMLIAVGALIGALGDHVLSHRGFEVPRATLVAALRGRSQKLALTVPAGRKSMRFLIAVPKGREIDVEALTGTATFSAEPGARVVITIGRPLWEECNWLDRYERVGFLLPSQLELPNQRMDTTVQVTVDLDSEPVAGTELWAYWLESRGLFGEP